MMDQALGARGTCGPNFHRPATPSAQAAVR
jgi:hypothetical protein